MAKAQYYPPIFYDRVFRLRQAGASRSVYWAGQGPDLRRPGRYPDLHGGAIAGQVKSAGAAQQQAFFQYQQTIQNAFREVEDSLADQANSREELEAQGRPVEALHTYERLARRRFENGYTNYLEVLDAERSLFNPELSPALTEGDALSGPGECVQGPGRRVGH